MWGVKIEKVAKFGPTKKVSLKKGLQKCLWGVKKEKVAKFGPKNKVSLKKGLKKCLWDVKIEKQSQRQLFLELSNEEQILMDMIRQNGEMGVDQLMANSGFNSSTLAMTLLELEMKNCITTLPGKRYQAL